MAEEDVWPLAPIYRHLSDPELAARSEADGSSTGHVGEWETSHQLHPRPERVDMA